MNQVQQPEALRLADELVEPIDGFQEPTQLEAAAAAELRRLHQQELANIEWMEKTDWVHKSLLPGELGRHRADVIRARIETQEAELRRLHARVQDLEIETKHAMSEASNLAQSLFDSHYSQDRAYSSGRITWALCDDLRGVISQISNMSVGLVRDIEPERNHSDEDAAIAAGKVQAAVQGRVG